MPADTRNAPIQDSLFGTLAVRYNFVLEHQVQEALNIQEQLKQSGQNVPRMGEILAQRGYITIDQVQAVLKGQLSSSPKRFGEIASASHFCTHADVEAALQVQNQIKACGSNQRLGEILVARGALRPHQVHAVLKEQGKAILACPGCNAKLNVSGVSPGSSVSCPRCKTVFTPPSGSESVLLDNNDMDANVRADMTVAMAPVGQNLNRIPSQVGPYQLGEKLGSDSSGVLFKAFDPQHGTTVALRILNPATANTRQAIDRWISAGEAASELTHPNLQRILSINTESGRVYLVMEYVEGESLRKSIVRRQKFPVLEAIDVLIQMAEALAYGHSHGVLHGDLRPAHVLIGFDGIVRISGLGTPKNVSQNIRQVAGQVGEESLPLYTPPELFIDEDNAEERSDIYSLGAIGYQMMSGRPPHEGTNVLQVGLRMASEAIKPPRDFEPRIPPYVNRLLCRCLLPEPDDRYDNMEALLDDLRKSRQALLSDLPDVAEIGAMSRNSGARPGVAPHRNLKAEAKRKKLRTHIARGGHGSTTGRYGAVTGKQRPVRPAGRSSGTMRAVQTPVNMASPVAPMSSAAGLPKVQVNRPMRKNGSEEESVDLLGDIDPLAVETSAHHGSPPPAGDVEPVREDREIAAAERRKKKREGPPLDPGVSAKWVLIGTFGAVLLVVGLIVLLGQNKPPVNTGTAPTVPDKPREPDPNTPVVVVTSNPGAASEWRQIQEHIKSNPQDYQGIVQRLDTFKLKYVDSPTPVEQAKEAVDQLKQYSSLGASSSLPELKAANAKFLEADKFSDAEKNIERWKDQWKGDADTAKTSKSLLDELAAKQKQMADSLMNSAMAARKEKKWEQAYAFYKRVAENYASQYADAARKARIDAMGDADASRSGEEKEAAQKKAAEAQAARDAAAPARLQALVSDLDSALKTFDLDQGKRLLDNAYDLLSGTPQGADFVELKGDYTKILGLRDRMVKSIGKLSDPKVTYRNQQYVMVGAAEKGPIIEVGTGKVPIAWNEITPDDLDAIAKRACNPDNGNEMLELGMLRYHLGDYRDAKKALNEAQRLGAVTTRYMTRVDAKLKELAAKPPEPEKTPEKPPEPDPKTVKAPEKQPPADDEVVKAMAAKGLEINRGQWVVSGNIFRGTPDVGDTDTKLMSLKASIKKNFTKVSVEVRGVGGEMAGFSFGKGRRYVIKPDGGWQKVTVERNNGGRPQLTIDGKPVESLDKVEAGVNPDNLVLDGILYLRFQGPKGEFRNLTIDN